MKQIQLLEMSREGAPIWGELTVRGFVAIW